MIKKIQEVKSVIDFQITMNKKCNLRCSHCYLTDYNDYEIKFSTLKDCFISHPSLHHSKALVKIHFLY